MSPFLSGSDLRILEKEVADLIAALDTLHATGVHAIEVPSDTLLSISDLQATLPKVSRVVNTIAEGEPAIDVRLGGAPPAIKIYGETISPVTFIGMLSGSAQSSYQSLLGQSEQNVPEPALVMDLVKELSGAIEQGKAALVLHGLIYLYHFSRGDGAFSLASGLGDEINNKFLTYVTDQLDFPIVKGTDAIAEVKKFLNLARYSPQHTLTVLMGSTGEVLLKTLHQEYEAIFGSQLAIHLKEALLQIDDAIIGANPDDHAKATLKERFCKMLGSWDIQKNGPFEDVLVVREMLGKVKSAAIANMLCLALGNVGNIDDIKTLRQVGRKFPELADVARDTLVKINDSERVGAAESIWGWFRLKVWRK